MKLIIVILVFVNSILYSQHQPEIYINVYDYFLRDWDIRASAISNVYNRQRDFTPLYQTANEFIPANGLARYGFDFITDNTGFGTWEIIAFGTYTISFFPEDSEEEIWSVTIDFRYCDPLYTFQDIYLSLYIDQNNNISFSWHWSAYPPNFINNNSSLNYWEMVNFSSNQECFDAEFYSHNYLARLTGLEDYGVLYIDNESYNSGTDLFQTIKGNTHNFRTYPTPIENENFLFRNWNIFQGSFENPNDIRIINNSDIEAYFYPTQPLTVTNSLEGGTGGNYNLTWTNKSLIPELWQYGAVYNAFDFNLNNQDRYNIEAPALTNVLGTNWHFKHWENGWTSSTRNNLIIPDSIPALGISQPTTRDI
ncbi:MAG: hypothetical protein IPM56_06280 [Ignavibacteriales bacterium]|nr:MAG: hypothetical protein IPM56_06280 [Ignavibacteriales bacterium]